MANIEVRKNGESAVATPRRERYAPLRMMRELMNWDPFREMMPVFPEQLATEFSPAFDVKETENAYVFKADVPGVKESDIEVTLTGNRLTINGERNEEKEEKGETYYSCERKYGSFTRSYTLPEGADAEHIHADLKSGVLTVAVPKLAAVQPKTIPVKSAPVKA